MATLVFEVEPYNPVSGGGLTCSRERAFPNAWEQPVGAWSAIVAASLLSNPPLSLRSPLPTPFAEYALRE